MKIVYIFALVMIAAIGIMSLVASAVEPITTMNAALT